MLKIIIISGWAAPEKYLKLLSDDLAGISEVSTVSIHEMPSLVSDGAAGENASGIPVSDYALGLISMIKESGPCLLVGWSTGGMIALEAALHLSDKVKGLILISTAARFSSDDDYRHGTAPSVVRTMTRGVMREPERTLTDFFERAHEPFSEDAGLIREEVDAALSIGSEGLLAGLKYLLERDLRALLGSINIPSVVLHGKEDAIIPWQAGKFLSDNIQNSSFRLIDGIGHDLPVRGISHILEEVERALKTIG
jgi:pimeloyl-ACP methyl ester carboxylesterase